MNAPQSRVPVIAVSMGDPGGIGPEVLVKALADPALRERARFHVHGIDACLAAAAARASIPRYWTIATEPTSGAGAAASPTSSGGGSSGIGGVVVIDSHARGRAEFPTQPDLFAGELSFRFVVDAISDAQRGPGDPRRADAICTGPINKQSWALAGHSKYPGHTELLKDRFNAEKVAMFFHVPREGGSEPSAGGKKHDVQIGAAAGSAGADGPDSLDFWESDVEVASGRGRPASPANRNGGAAGGQSSDERARAGAPGSLVVHPFNVILATVHIPLMKVRGTLTIGRLFEIFKLGHDGCVRLGIEKPRIAVCGLNPHAGEGGLLGEEEERFIAPAIEVAQESGLHVQGPFPGDTVFNAAVAGNFDLVVAMYHDQGLIPVKLLARDRAVNCTLGLPVIRTSPDHGTAFDIAGKNIADPGSMKSALELAVRMAGRSEA